MAAGAGRAEGDEGVDVGGIARTLADAGADPKLADAITAAVREAADHGDHVTPDQFKGSSPPSSAPPSPSCACSAEPSTAHSSRPPFNHGSGFEAGLPGRSLVPGPLAV